MSFTTGSDGFDALRQSIKAGKVLVPGSQEYEDSLRRWSETCVKPAAVVVKPASAGEVSDAIKFATTNGIPLTVKCGGHSTSGTSSCEGGMVIDLGLLRDVRVNPAEKTVTFGGGCLWQDVDQALWEHGLATVGGTVSDTGVGGLILGGGFGFLTPRYGLTIDILLEAEVVTADGRVLRVAEDENQDLFWAVRGAGQSFGVATSFTVRAFDQGPCYAGMVLLSPTALPTIVDFVNFVHEAQDANSAMVTGPTRFPPDGEEGYFCMIFYNGNEEEGKKFYRPILDAATLNTASVKTWPEVNSQLGQIASSRKLLGGATFVPPLKLEDVQRAAEKMFRFTEEHLGVQAAIQWEILPNSRVRSTSHKATAFAARDDAYQICPFWQWDDPELDGVVRRVNREVVTKLRESGVKTGVTQYNNYNIEDDVPPEKAYGSNVERLQRLKEKYDPTNIFHKWNSFRARR
ncbi:hypothetical protein GGS20DRAFT_576699 [Poronia punctata]|nr:hypothetical protein GGS20DRAFT_576699 [Poronia punctata]